MTDTSSTPTGDSMLRIGELSRRTGVSDHLLRSWESRYALLSPQRTSGGFRLYSLADEQRVMTMKSLLDRGLSPAQAARVALAPEEHASWTTSLELTGILDAASVPQPPAVQSPAAPRVPPAASVRDSPPPSQPWPAQVWETERHAIFTALAALEDQRAHRVMDQLLADFSTEAVLREVVVPLLREIGESWARAELSVAREHFAASWVRGRLNALGRGWATGSGPLAVVASPEGELHDLAGMVFGIALHRRGWRIVHLGANMPIANMDLGGDPLPDLVVCSALTPSPLDIGRDSLRALATRTRVLIAGSGANPELARDTNSTYLPDDPVTAAARVADGNY